MTLYDFLSGAVSLGFFVCALFFLRFWRRTRDRLFVIFAVAFWLLGVNWLLLAFTDPNAETQRLLLYALRAVAFILILIAILDKNRKSAR